jgi:excisionase family DNA binding protein
MEEGKLLWPKLDAIKALGGISVRTLERLISAKQLKVVRIGRRVLIPRKSLEEFCKRKMQ